MAGIVKRKTALRPFAAAFAGLVFGGLVIGGAAAAQVSTAGVPLGDVGRGAELWEQECAICHLMGEGAEHDIGPHLNRVFDRRAGALEDFEYSESIVRMGRDGMRWRFETLDAYIENRRCQQIVLVPALFFRANRVASKARGRRGDPPCPASIRPNSAACLPA